MTGEQAMLSSTNFTYISLKKIDLILNSLLFLKYLTLNIKTTPSN